MTTREPHACTYRWCTNVGSLAVPGEHHCGEYVPSTGKARAAQRSFEVADTAVLGCGLTLDEPEMVYPTVWVHIFAGEGRHDVSIELTLDQAMQFEAMLTDVITTGMTVQPERNVLDAQQCRNCHRETDRAGWRFDQLCADCDYCKRYGHVGVGGSANTESNCSRCGFPRYERPPSKLEVSD